MGETQHADNPFKTSALYDSSLKTVSANQLQKADIPPLRFIVDGLLPEGLSILAAPPKFGKSWFSLGLCLSVASGATFLEHSTVCADVLYLALEDSLRRLQGRQERLLQGNEAPDNLHYAVAAGTLDGALNAQIDEFMKAHPGTGLVVIDVLARVRSQAVTLKSDAYRIDYSDMGTIKSLADRHHIAILVVHHTRKMRDDTDVFNMISGSNGLLGAADTSFVLCKEKRSDHRATLHIIGRDVEAAELVIEMQDCRWRRIGTTDEVIKQSEQEAFEAHPLVRLIRQMLDDSPDGSIKTTAEQLKTALQEQSPGCSGLDSAKKVGRFLADDQNKRLFRLIGIEMDEQKEQAARYKTFRRNTP